MSDLLRTLKPNDVVWGFRFVPAEFSVGKKVKDSVITEPIKGIMACERVEKDNDKALSNEDDKIQYFVPVDSTGKPMWLKSQHVLNGWYFAKSRYDAVALRSGLIDEYKDELMTEVVTLKKSL